MIEIDARTLVHQLNQPTSDLPVAVVGRWLAYIRLFSFDIKHVAGVKHKGPDAVSRRPGTEEALRELAEGGEEAVRRLEEFVDGELDVMWVSEEEEEACRGFVIVFLIRFLCYFLCFAEERESAAMWWAFVFLLIRLCTREKRVCRGWGSIWRRCGGQRGCRKESLRGLRGSR